MPLKIAEGTSIRERRFMKEGEPIPFGHLPPEEPDKRETPEYIDSLREPVAPSPKYDPNTGIVEMTPGEFVDLIDEVKRQNEEEKGGQREAGTDTEKTK